MEFANGLSLPSEQLNMACRTAAPFFATPIAESLRNPKCPGVMALSCIIREAALAEIWRDKSTLFARHPASISDFVAMTESIFSEHLLHHLQSQATYFDAVSGISCISACFICSRPIINAVEDVIWGIIIYSSTKAGETLPQSTFSTTESYQGRQPPPQNTQSSQPSSSRQTVAGPSTDVRSPSGSGAVHSPCRIQQINLEGATIAEAWCANATTNGLEGAAIAAVGPDEDPSTMRFRPLAVYHGTDVDIGDRERTVADPRHDRLNSSVKSNQVAPTAWGVLPVVWTGFSPLRCFLWAAFKGEVLQNIPIGTPKGRLEQSWNCNSDSDTIHRHEGVTLLQFRPPLPSAPGQTHYVMPKGREAEWHRIALNYGGEGFGEHALAASRVKYLWDQFANIHGGALDTWPETLHCREFGSQVAMVRSFTKQLWRTVWFDAGVNALNNSHEVTYAISFKLTIPAPPHVSQNKETSRTG
ncbi:hypothetical protein BR93DRAFT_922703 [Coniochaeta sp. PMI_546]|nr:hypothetical protein BR93DRAFT_922703 [Coniochaeta sp. PMI_546]